MVNIYLLVHSNHNTFRSITDDTWKDVNVNPFLLIGTSLSQKVIGIFGFGRIGYATAKRFRAFEPKKIIFTSTTEKPEAEHIGAHQVSFEELLKQSDVLIITASLNEMDKIHNPKIDNSTVKKNLKFS